MTRTTYMSRGVNFGRHDKWLHVLKTRIKLALHSVMACWKATRETQGRRRPQFLVEPSRCCKQTSNGLLNVQLQIIMYKLTQIDTNCILHGCPSPFLLLPGGPKQDKVHASVTWPSCTWRGSLSLTHFFMGVWAFLHRFWRWNEIGILGTSALFSQKTKSVAFEFAQSFSTFCKFKGSIQFIHCPFLQQGWWALCWKSFWILRWSTRHAM